MATRSTLATVTLRALFVVAVVGGVLGTGAAVSEPLDVEQVLLTSAPLGRGACWGADEDEVGAAASDVLNAIVMRAILQCGRELGLSAAQMDRLESVADGFMRDTAGRQTRLAVRQLELLALLRPDPADPGRPADLEAAERAIQEIARITVEQDVALLHTIEALKAALTAEQRAALATLLVAPPPAIL